LLKRRDALRSKLEGRPQQVKLDDLPGFSKPAMSRYRVATPNLLKCFSAFNKNKPYAAQVKPFNFMFAYQANAQDGADVKAVGPAYPDRAEATRHVFNRLTGGPIQAMELKSYDEALAQFHLHPEAKFLNADFTDAGITGRRHVLVTHVEHIGKEANRWDEQLHLGADPSARTSYGVAPDDLVRCKGRITASAGRHRVRSLARAAGIDAGQASRILRASARQRLTCWPGSTRRAVS
jgi:hypothetical protein